MVLWILAIFSTAYVIKAVFLIFDSNYYRVLCSFFVRDILLFWLQISFDLIPASVLMYQHYQRMKEVEA